MSNRLASPAEKSGESTADLGKSLASAEKAYIASGGGGLISRRNKLRALGGTAVSLCVMVIAFLFFAIFFPGNLDSADAVQPKLRHYVTKVATFLSSNKKPDIVLLGSSLMLCPATLCDLQEEGRMPLDKDWYSAIFMPSYERAKYFEKLLNARCHSNCQIENLAVASSLMADHCLMLQALVGERKAPQLIVCGIAPRDFIDNNQPNLLATPVHTLLEDIRPELFPSMATRPPESFVERKILKIKRAISCLRSSLNSCFCFLADRPENDNAGKMVPGVLHLPASKAKDLVVYKKVYIPVNEQRFSQQSAYLEKMLLTAKDQNIAVLLVNMPLTPENAKLLPVAFLTAKNNEIKNIAAKYQAQLLDLQQSPQFEGADFIDSCHLNARGGAKFYQVLVNTIQQTGLLHGRRD